MSKEQTGIRKSIPWGKVAKPVFFSPVDNSVHLD